MSEFLLIVGGAPEPAHEEFYSGLLSRAARVLAADSGAELCVAHGRLPDVLVGDMDSIDQELLARLTAEGVDVRRFPASKDQTDLQLALQAARESDPAKIVVTASFGARLDHTLAAMGAIADAVKGLGVVEIADPGLSGWVMEAGYGETLRLQGAGSTVSVFGMTPDARVTLVNFRYEIADTVIGAFAPRGVSNELADGVGELRSHQGVIVVLSPSVGDVGPATRV